MQPRFARRRSARASGSDRVSVGPEGRLSQIDAAGFESFPYSGWFVHGARTSGCCFSLDASGSRDAFGLFLARWKFQSEGRLNSVGAFVTATQHAAKIARRTNPEITMQAVTVTGSTPNSKRNPLPKADQTAAGIVGGNSFRADAVAAAADFTAATDEPLPWRAEVSLQSSPEISAAEKHMARISLMNPSVVQCLDLLNNARHSKHSPTNRVRYRLLLSGCSFRRQH